MNNKRILFVCNYFAPENTIAAVRISKLVKYFRVAEYDVDVLTERKDNIIVDETLIDDVKGVRVLYAENTSTCKKICNLYAHLIRPHKEKRFKKLDKREKINPKTGNIEFYPFETAYPFIGSLDYLVGQYRQINLANSAKNAIDSCVYDIIITSYGDSFSYFVGKQFAASHKNVPWIFDIRDAIYRYKFTPDYIKWIPLKYEKYIWKHADAIVGVSKGICKRVPKRYRSKTYCITNGFEKVVDVSSKEQRASKKMTFTYTGSMYGGLQNLSDFFETVRLLVEENFVEADVMEFHYAGNASAYDIFKGQAKKYSLESNCVYHGKLQRQDAIALQRQSDILLMASYDYKNNNGGVITGKLLEYMAAERPVIAIVTGDGENSEVSQIISKTNIGICCECSKGIDDRNKLKRYIFEQYQCFKKGIPLRYNPVISEIEKFDYKNIANRYIRLLQNLEGRRD